MGKARKPSGDRVARSWFFRRAESKASYYAKDPNRLQDFLDRARRKAENKRGSLNDVWDSLMLLFRMLRAYATREYTQIPLQSLILIIASIVYFLMPVDLIPDPIPVLGLADDAALLGWTVRSVRADMEKFAEWERARTA